MNDSDEVQFLKVVNGLAAFFGRPIESESLALWWDAMRDWSLTDFKAAAAQLAKTAKFMPRPADFNELRKAGKSTPGEAWELAIRHASSSEYRKKPEIGDELIDAVVRMIGGYEVIAMCDMDKLHFLERRFCEHYETLEDRVEIRKEVPTIAYQIYKPQLKVVAGTFKKIVKPSDGGDA